MGNRFIVLSYTPCLSLLEGDRRYKRVFRRMAFSNRKYSKTFKEQQRKDDSKGPYRFQRKTERALDTLTNDGWGIQ